MASKENIGSYSAMSGRMIKEDGTVVNIADLLAGDQPEVSQVKEKISSYQPRYGRMIREDGSLINIADLIASGQIGGGGGSTGTTNYNSLTNKPQINGVEVSGDKTSDDYGVVSKDQGPENSGKILRVNESGEVLPSDEPEISVVEHVIFLSRPEVETT